MSVRWVAALILAATSAMAQHQRGELHLDVRDPAGNALIATVGLQSDLNQIHRGGSTNSAGAYAAFDLPFGVYRVTVSRDGFQTATQPVRIESEVPVHLAMVLGVAPVQTVVNVSETATLIDPSRTANVNSVGAQSIAEHLSPQPGRGLLDLINMQPGWLYEANGVLHPRGSEYDVQFVVDGAPLGENRSPAFAPSFESEDVESMRILTAGYPAEYGRKLGGIVEVSSAKDTPAGWHGAAEVGSGSFDSWNGYAALTYGHGPDHLSLDGYSARTDRYLDPPVLANFTNTGSSGGGSASYARDLSSRDRLRVEMREGELHFDVPNEMVQQNAGQRQDRGSKETAGLAYYERVLSPSLLLDAEASIRDDSAALWSNALSIPVDVTQQRGFREGYARAEVAWQHGRHNFKFGTDAIFNSIHEALQYAITDPEQFDPATPGRFAFAGKGMDHEQSAFVQDAFHAGAWNVNAGIRFDRYRLLARATGWSPRVAVSRYFARPGILVHVSYDRAFQTPAMENLLLASSPAVDVLNDTVIRLPVPPSRANFYEAGVEKAFFGRLRLAAEVFRRDFRDAGDDDVLLNTGVSFPISFHNARIRGEEVKIEVPRWGRFSGFVSYSNQLGIAQGPVTGGLFLGDDAVTALSDNSRFFVTQDQRNTARGRLRLQLPRRVWTAATFSYGSGLPADLSGANTSYEFLLAQYGPQVLSRVNFDRQRVRPSESLDAAAGVDLLRRDRRALTVQVEADNLTNHLNLLNFASLFSGTAIGMPRSASVQVRVQF